MRRFYILILAGVIMLGCSVNAVESFSVPTCSDCPFLTVTKVIDGDTFISPSGRVRLYGINTPEYGQDCHAEATERLTALAEDKVRVEEGPKHRDIYERQLYYVYTVSGHSIDAVLIREGLALAWRGEGQHSNLLVHLEERTQQKRIGCLWAR